MLTALWTSAGHVFCTLKHNVAPNWLYLNWIGYQSGTYIRAGIQPCLEMLAQYRCHCLLNDNRQVLGDRDESIE